MPARINKEKEDEVRALKESNLPIKDIVAQTGVSKGAIYCVLKRDAHPSVKRKVQQESVFRLYQEGMSVKEIGSALDLTERVVRSLCKEVGIKLPKYKKCNPEQQKQICDMYLSGESYKAIEVRFRIHENSVVKILRKNGIEPDRANIALSDEQRDEIFQLYYEDMLPPTDIAKKLGMSVNTIKTTIARHGKNSKSAQSVSWDSHAELREEEFENRLVKEIEKLRKIDIPEPKFINFDPRYLKVRKHTFDPGFFSRNTPEAAYFAGFLFADGSLKQISKKSYSLRCEIHKKDRSVLEKWCKHMKADSGKIIRENNRKCVYAIFTKTGFDKDLLRWGIIPRKTYDYKHIAIPKNLYGPFITGVIDGDGCIFTDGFSKKISITGNKEAIWQMAAMLRELGVNCYMGVCESNGCYGTLSISDSNYVNKMSEILEIQKVPFLERKWNKIL